MRPLRLLTLALVALTIDAGGARAEVKKFAYLCGSHEGIQEICAFYQIALTPPDNDIDGNEFVLDVVMTGATKAALEAAEKDYIAFLKAH